MTQDELDIFYMRRALAEAKVAMSEGEVPIGAVIVSGDRIIGKSHNLTESLNDVTAHAEIQAITAAANCRQSKYLDDATIYVTVEPCLMCAGAIGWAQVSRIVIGAVDEKRGYSTMTSKSPFHPKATVCVGVLAEECKNLMTEFFRQRR